MTVTSLRFKDDQYRIIKQNARFEGVNVTTYMRQAVLARVEDSADYRDAIRNLRADHGKTVSREKVMKDAGLK